MTLQRTTPGNIDPITDEATGATVTYAPVRGVFTKIGTDYALTHEVQAGDRMAVIDASAKPEMTDKLVIGASALSIVNIITVNPAGTPVAYKLQVRGSVDDSAYGGDFGNTAPTRTINGGTFDDDDFGVQAPMRTVNGGSF